MKRETDLWTTNDLRLMDSSESTIDLAGAKILIVDDMPANLQILRGALEPEGYNILIATNGEGAIKSAGAANPDLILLDVQMPGMDGFEACRVLKADPGTREIPVIFLTAQVEIDDVVKGLELGAVDYVTKPFDSRELLRRVRTHLELYKLRQEMEAAREAAERELQTAKKMQMGLMPPSPPAVEGLDVSGRCISANHVGGDLFQYFQSQESLSIALADVTGKAMDAAIPAVMFSGILDNQMEDRRPLQELFRRLNRSLHRSFHRSFDTRTFVCFEMAEIDTSSLSVRYANGGLPFPYHYHNGELSELQLDSYPLGVLSDAVFDIIETQLTEGDYLVFCSDGIAEAEQEEGEQFGYERTSEAVVGACRDRLSAEGLIDHLVSAVDEFRAGAPRKDDMTCVVVKVTR